MQPGWPPDAGALAALQERLGAVASARRTADPWRLPPPPVLAGGCFIAHPTGTSGAGHAGDPATAASVVLATSTAAGRTPVPLARARTAARSARARAAASA